MIEAAKSVIITAAEYKKAREAVGKQREVAVLLGLKTQVIGKRERGRTPITKEAELALLSLPHKPAPVILDSFGKTRIYLDKGMYCTVSPEDYDILNQWRWRATRQANGRYYAMRTVQFLPKSCPNHKRTVIMHREIMKRTGAEIAFLEIDHVNRDGLDNRRENLRVATKAQNLANSIRHRSGKHSPYKGVTFKGGSGGKWSARVADKHVGTYSTAEEAGRAYDAAATERWGAFARLNFPAK